jgi:hypothetical protein
MGRDVGLFVVEVGLLGLAYCVDRDEGFLRGGDFGNSSSVAYASPVNAAKDSEWL